MPTADHHERPVWLLDVDGVLNAATGTPDETAWPAWRTGRATAAGGRWQITWAPPVIEAIRRIHDTGSVDVLWLTTWEDAANESLAPLLGLPELPVASRARGGDPGRAAHGFTTTRAAARNRWWKLDVARRVLDPEPYRPLVWTDDDLSWEPDARAWAEQRPSPTLLVAPATDVGLTAEHLEAIEEFCRAYGPGAAKAGA
jgi:hypothetical protein